MRIIKSILYIMTCLFLLSSCQEQDLITTSGGFLIELTDDVNITTKALPAELSSPLKSKFNIEIENALTGTVIYDNLLPENGRIAASEGLYHLTASYGINPDLAYDAPYYKGILENQEVTAQQTKSVEITCKVANALASVEYVNADLFETMFGSNYGLEVTAGDVELNWTLARQDKNPYFKAEQEVKFAFRGILLATGKVVTFEIINDNFIKPEPGINYILKLRLTESSSSAISIQTEVIAEPVTISETIPATWLPAPKIESEAFINGILDLYETEQLDVRFDFKVAAPLQDLRFTLDFEDPALNVLNQTYLLSELTSEQLIALNDAGIRLPEIGSTAPVADLTGLMNNLTALTDGSDAVNKITWDAVKANDRTSESATYTIQTKAPVFNIQIPTGSIWTKEVTAEALIEKGDADVIKTNLSYEYSTDGYNWIVAGQDALINNLNPGTSYQVRGRYKNYISESCEVSTYPLIPLTNGNLSSYSIVDGVDHTWGNALQNPGNKGAQFEWSGWATLNELTADHCLLTAYSYNSRSGTRPVSDVRPGSNDDVAAWIITIGYGYGGTNNNPKHKVPGELFLGVYNTKGISFKSKPTGVKFWYKYAPYDNDQSDIKVEIYSNDIIIGSGYLNQNKTISTYTEHLMEIQYDDNYKNLIPDKISLVFKSGKNTSVEKRESGGLTTARTANPMYRGSELYIDDLSLIYDK